MAAENPAFDVESRIDENHVKRDFLKNPLSENEVEEKLDGYIKIPKESWHLLRRDMHIRYFAIIKDAKGKVKKSEFRQGGFIVANPTTTKDAEPKRAISFQTQPTSIQKKGSSYRFFCIPYDTIDKIYTKITLEMSLMLGNNQIIVRMINENADKANEVNQKLVSKTDKLSLVVKKLSLS
jgi:hypothetical protein